MTRHCCTRSSSFRYLLLPLLLSLLLILHGVFLTRNYLLSSDNNYGSANYFNEDDDTQWRLNVMLGRGAPFDNLLDNDRLNEGADDLDVPSDQDSLGNSNLNENNNNLDSADNNDEIPIPIPIPITSQDNNEPAVEIINSPIIISNNNNKRDDGYDNDINNTAREAMKETLRPKRNPKGYRFRGWTHPREFNIWSSRSDAGINTDNNNDDANSDNNGSNDTNNNNDNDRAWWRNNSRCFEIDYICHRPKSNQWAYMTSTKWEQKQQPQQQVVFQPTMELKPSAHKYDGGRYNAEVRIGIKVDSPTRVKEKDDDDKFVFEQCQLSTTDTHIVLQSLFNDMVGEFYSRSLLGLYQTMMKGVQQQQHQDGDEEEDGTDGNNSNIAKEGTSTPPSSPPPLPWEQDIQFYIHIALKNKQVLDGHKLFTAGMLSNPNTGMAIPFLDLFPPPPPPGEEDHDGQEDHDDCQCYRKMVFCGYDAYTHDEEVNSEDIDTVEDYSDGRRRQRNEEEGEKEEAEGDPADEEGEIESETEEVEQTNSNNKETSGELAVSDDNNTPSFNPNLKYTLWSAGTVSPYSKTNSPHTRDRPRGAEFQGYANLRNLMSSNFVKHYPTLGDDIAKFRREALLAKGLISNDYIGDTREWLVVGLTQRTYRRAWLNLPTAMKQCNAELNDRSVIFIEVNVEETSSPYEQLILHRSLDVVIGVHGAQLTQAVVMPPLAHVLEILPWVPSYIRGVWVTRRSSPTPLGVIYHNTDLNHAGFSLDRTSTDLCVGVGEVGSEEEKECFLSRRKMFIWDNRDFNVEPEVIIKYIEKLVLFMRDDEMGKVCAEVKDRLDERFVLYNVWCAEEEEQSTLSVNHYYTKTPPPSEGEQYGLGKRKKQKYGRRKRQKQASANQLGNT